MNCVFCNSHIYVGDYLPKKELYTMSHSPCDWGWCKSCPIPIGYSWKWKFPSDPLSKEFASIALCDNTFPKYPYYHFCLDYENVSTQLIFLTDRHIDLIFKINSILNINPSNFYQKLNAYLAFS